MSRRRVRALTPSLVASSGPVKVWPDCIVASSASIRSVTSAMVRWWHRCGQVPTTSAPSLPSMTTSAMIFRGITVNNLVGLDLDIPREQLVVIVGRSGSGKSSLVADTLAAEAGHQLNETFPPFTRNRLPKWRSEEHTSELQSRGHLV